MAEGTGIGDGMKSTSRHVYSTSGAAPASSASRRRRALARANELAGLGGEPKRQICARTSRSRPDGKSLYVTACDDVYRIRLRVAGVMRDRAIIDKEAPVRVIRGSLLECSSVLCERAAQPERKLPARVRSRAAPGVAYRSSRRRTRAVYRLLVAAALRRAHARGAARARHARQRGNSGGQAATRASRRSRQRRVPRRSCKGHRGKRESAIAAEVPTKYASLTSSMTSRRASHGRSARLREASGRRAHVVAAARAR